MALERYEVYPNARVNYGGNDVTIYDQGPEVTRVILDDGEVKTYLTDAIFESGSVYEPPQDAQTTDTPAPGPGAGVAPAPGTDATVAQPQAAGTDPNAPASPTPVSPVDPTQTDGSGGNSQENPSEPSTSNTQASNQVTPSLGSNPHEQA